MGSSLDIPVVGDLHYVCEADHVCPIEERRSSLGPMPLRKAVHRLKREGIAVQLVVILGDVTDDGHANNAGKAAVKRPGLPLIALQHNPLHPNINSGYPHMPGNNDAVLSSYHESGVILSLSGHWRSRTLNWTGRCRGFMMEMKRR